MKQFQTIRPLKILNQCLFYLSLFDSELSTENDAIDFSDFVMNHSIEPGCLASWKGGNDQSIRDYAGIGAVAACLDYSVALAIVHYGRTTHWIGTGVPFPNWLIAHLEYAAGLKPTLWRQLCLVKFILFAGLSERTRLWDHTIVSFSSFSTRDKSILCAMAHRKWQKRFKRDYPMGMPQFVSQLMGKDHPIVKHYRVDHNDTYERGSLICEK